MTLPNVTSAILGGSSLANLLAPQPFGGQLNKLALLSLMAANNPQAVAPVLAAAGADAPEQPKPAPPGPEAEPKTPKEEVQPPSLFEALMGVGDLTQGQVVPPVVTPGTPAPPSPSGSVNAPSNIELLLQMLTAPQTPTRIPSLGELIFGPQAARR